MLYFEATKKYFKNIAINLFFSALMLSSFHIKTGFIKLENFSAKSVIALILFEILTVVICMIYIACIVREIPRRIHKSFLAVITWSIVYFANSLFVREIYLRSLFSKGILFMICAFIYALLLGLMILSFCSCICSNYKREASMFSLKNAFFFIKNFSMTIALFIALCIASFAPVNTRGGRTFLVIVPKETTALWEKRIFILILFIYLPLYVLTFVQLFKEISEKQR